MSWADWEVTPIVSTEINWQGDPVCPKCGSADVTLEPPTIGDRMIVKGDYLCAGCDYTSPAEDAEWFPAETDDDE